MNILFVNNLYAPYLIGGAERIVQTLAEGMVTRGHVATVLTTGPESALREDVINGVRVLRAGVRNMYALAAAGARPPSWKRALWHLADVYNPLMRSVVSDVLRLVQPHIVNLHNITGFSSSIWDAIRQAGLPMAQVLHDQYLLCPRSVMFRGNHLCERQCLSCRTMRFLHPRLSNKVDAVVGVSRFILDHHLRHGYFRTSPVKSVIHNAQRNTSALSVPGRKPDSIVRFGYIGNLAQHKGIELLLRAFRESARSDWQLHVAGTGHAQYVTNLREQFAAPNVDFRGSQKPGDFYPDIDILVVPSICNEALSIVTFEAMSYGVPVVGSRRGGIPEIIENGLNGLLFDPDRPSDLEAAMTRMADDGQLRTSMSHAARESARYFLDVDRFLSKYEELLQGLCQGRLGKTAS